MKRLFIFIVFWGMFFCFSHAQYSIKNRWNTKLSLSYNRTNYHNLPFVLFEGKTHPIQAMLNLRAECNYGILNWLEIGGYIGYIRHHNCKDFLMGAQGNYIEYAFAPSFGVNTNVHLLPFWVKNKNSRWELYLTAKYGGAYLINHVGFWSNGISISSNGTRQSFLQCFPMRYRQIYGVGVGGGVYFWNVFGLNAEVMGGQYSYFPEVCPVYWTARVGIEFKFYSKKHKERIKNEQAEEMYPAENE